MTKLHKIVASDSGSTFTACGYQWREENLRIAREDEVSAAYDGDGICRRCRKSLMPPKWYVEAQRRNP